jgi:hypothetical protein
VQYLGERVCATAEASPEIRRHPFLATGLAALLGYVGGPLVLRGLGRMLEAASGLSSAGAPQASGLTGSALAFLRRVRRLAAALEHRPRARPPDRASSALHAQANWAADARA